jgi:hypothetical protein
MWHSAFVRNDCAHELPGQGVVDDCDLATAVGEFGVDILTLASPSSLAKAVVVADEDSAGSTAQIYPCMSWEDEPMSMQTMWLVPTSRRRDGLVRRAP